MASGGENAADRSMKAMSSEVVEVIVFAIGVVTPVAVFSTVFIIRWTRDNSSKDHLL